jgi:hypothetical protein
MPQALWAERRARRKRIWKVFASSSGEVTGTIQGGAGAHKTVVSNNGQYVYLGGRNYNHAIYKPLTPQVKETAPLVGSVRPLTANGKNTLAFTSATGVGHVE